MVSRPLNRRRASNAGQTLIAMVILLCTMFVGLTFLANQYQVIAVPHSNVTVLSEIARAVFGNNSVMFYYLQFSTLVHPVTRGQYIIRRFSSSGLTYRS